MSETFTDFLPDVGTCLGLVQPVLLLLPPPSRHASQAIIHTCSPGSPGIVADSNSYLWTSYYSHTRIFKSFLNDQHINTVYYKITMDSAHLAGFACLHVG